jgi:hypothetical protein
LSIGICTPHEGVCLITSDDDCLQSGVCRVYGMASYNNTSRVARSDDDCLLSEMCAKKGACVFKNGIQGRRNNPDPGTNSEPVRTDARPEPAVFNARSSG